MIAKIDQLTSSVYGCTNPPADWRDGVFLVPHEMIRRETTAMARAVEALHHLSYAWQVTLLARWYTEHYFGMIMEHHDNEEEVYFPFLKDRGAKLSDENKISVSHRELVTTLKQFKAIFETILEKKGRECHGEIDTLKTRVPVYVKNLFEHLAQEEHDNIPPALRATSISEAESDAVVEKIIARAGLGSLKYLFPAVLVASRDWMSDDFYAHFEQSLPPPIMDLIKSTLVPNFHAIICPMRDAPSLSVEPDLTKEIPLDMSKLPPPPLDEEKEK